MYVQHFYQSESKVLQYFSNFILYFSSYNKSSLAFKVEAIILHYLKPSFCQFFNAILILVQDKGFLH